MDERPEAAGGGAHAPAHYQAPAPHGATVLEDLRRSPERPPLPPKVRGQDVTQSICTMCMAHGGGCMMCFKTLESKGGLLDIGCCRAGAWQASAKNVCDGLPV